MGDNAIMQDININITRRIQMKRNEVKKVLSLAIVTVVSASMVACSNANSSEETSSSIMESVTESSDQLESENGENPGNPDERAQVLSKDNRHLCHIAGL